jgi:uncharacterized membrane protein (DUF485 family)
MDPTSRIATSEVFNTAVTRHRRATVGLFIGFIAFYFALLVGAAYFRDVFTTQVWGRVNVGLLFALSQYLVAGLVAWTYVSIMRKTDRAMDSVKQ